MNVFTNPNQVHVNYGLKIAGGLIVYFLIMKFAGLLNIVELRLLNLVIQVAGVYMALRTFKRTHEDHLNYFRALVTGVGTAAIGAIIFAAFLFIYMEFIDTAFMQYIIDNEPMGRFLNPYMASFIVALEGVFSGLLVTFVLINYVDTDEPSEA
ncbi:MAG: DUF4199 domain-containing protein [Cyclobacteriaceae bacterium]|jgi:hypothetical protein|nr:DUF4199 domain-containing protein [Cyclobacteriaceae bacterium]